MRGKTMEHAQKRKINFKGILTSSRTKRVALYALYFLAGLLGSRGMVFVRYAPFGAAAVAAVPIRSMGCDCRQFGWLHMAVQCNASNSIHSGDYCNCYYSLYSK